MRGDPEMDKENLVNNDGDMQFSNEKLVLLESMRLSQVEELEQMDKAKDQELVLEANERGDDDFELDDNAF